MQYAQIPIAQMQNDYLYKKKCISFCLMLEILCGLFIVVVLLFMSAMCYYINCAVEAKMDNPKRANTLIIVGILLNAVLITLMEFFAMKVYKSVQAHDSGEIRRWSWIALLWAILITIEETIVRAVENQFIEAICALFVGLFVNYIWYLYCLSYARLLDIMSAQGVKTIGNQSNQI